VPVRGVASSARPPEPREDLAIAEAGESDIHARRSIGEQCVAVQAGLRAQRVGPAREDGGELVQSATHDQGRRLLAADEQRQVSEVALPSVEQRDAQGLVEAGGDEALPVGRSPAG
jgi:hypothetical protein